LPKCDSKISKEIRLNVELTNSKFPLTGFYTRYESYSIDVR